MPFEHASTLLQSRLPLGSPQNSRVSIRYGGRNRRSPRGKAEAGENFLNCCRWIDRRKYPHLCATAGARKDIKSEYPGHQLTPWIISRLAAAPFLQRALRFEAGMPALRRIEANTARTKICNTSLTRDES